MAKNANVSDNISATAHKKEDNTAAVIAVYMGKAAEEETTDTYQRRGQEEVGKSFETYKKAMSNRVRKWQRT